MQKKKCPVFLLAGLILIAGLNGCGKKTVGSGTAEKKETVTVAFWSDQLTENYGQYLQKTFPEVDFEFYVITNSTDYYRFRAERKALPDILTVRRFSLGDVASFKDSLMDLSDTELAGTFHQSYLRSYTYSDGTMNWLPACAEIDSILVNQALLEEHKLDIPTDYQEFTEVCVALKEAGIRPFRSDFAADYTCMEILQGLSVQSLTSQEGREWRQQYESGQTNQLSREVWLPVFERMQEFIDLAGIGASDLESSIADTYYGFQENETAMIRGTSAEAVRYNVEEKAVMIPYCGETKEDSWYLSYPAFQIAANVKAEESPKREKLILDIMSAMLGQEGLEHIATGQDMIAYNKDVKLECSSILERMQPYIDNNRLYIRLASADMFSASRRVVRGMILGEYPDAEAAFDAFNEAMKEDDEGPSFAAHIDTGYSYRFEPEGGSPAASAVMNSLREELGTQFLTGQSINVSGDILSGDYTEEELRYLTMGEAVEILLCEMTGRQLTDYLNQVFAASGKRGSVINDSSLYVSSGFEMEVRKTDNGYMLEKLTMGGEELALDDIYSVAVLGNEWMMQKEVLASVGVTEYTRSENTYKQIITDRLLTGKQLAAPTPYITLRREAD